VCYSLAELYVKSVYLNFSGGVAVKFINYFKGAQGIKFWGPLERLLAKGRKTALDLHQEQDFSLATAYRQSLLEPTQPPIQWLLVTSFPVDSLKLPKIESKHSRPPRAEINSVWIYTFQHMSSRHRVQ
jgi:hypothetical protein